MINRLTLVTSVMLVITALVLPLSAQSGKPGYDVNLHLAGLPGNPTSITFDDLGRIFVLCMPGQIVRGEDIDNDGVADVAVTVFDGNTISDFLFPFTGVTWHNGKLYLSSRGKISELSDLDLDGFFESHTHLVTGFPTTNHQNNAIVFDENDQLYYAYGSLTDHGPEPMTVDTASIQTCDISGNNLTTFATGLRNVYGMAYKQGFGFVTVDNGPNFIFDNLHPPDELNVVEMGKDYGFPAHYGIPPANSGTETPALLFAPHSAPCALDFNKGFSGWDTDVYVPLLVSPQGNIVRCTLHQNPTTGEYEGYQDIVAFGFQSPIDAKFSPDGDLFIADHDALAIYRISPSSPGRMTIFGTPRLGESIIIEVKDPNEGNDFYGFFMSTSDAPVLPIGGGRNLNLNVNTDMFTYTFSPGNIVNYFPFPGVLDANGAGYGIVHFPFYPPLAGLKTYMAWVSWDSAGNIGTTSEAFPFVIQP
ncbi:MAG: glucose/arabinose dehydrogenase [Planctomycetota bacterium]|jgi:glucose/arabinose dehydrogenase